MKNWNETTQVTRRLRELMQEGKRAALATVIAVKGSTYRREGAKLLIEPDGTLVGNVSGGCLEADLRERAMEVLHTGAPARIEYDTSDDDNTLWGLGMGCNGVVDLFVQEVDPFRHQALPERLIEQLGGNEPFRWSVRLSPQEGRGAILLSGEGGVLGAFPADAPVPFIPLSAAKEGSAILDVGEQSFFSEYLAPPPFLVVCGGGEDAVPLVDMAAQAGFRVVVADHRAAYIRADLFPRASAIVQCRAEDEETYLPFDRACYVVVKMHHTRHDAAWLRRAAAGQARYIGLLGPRARRDVLFDKMDLANDPRVFGPVGLDLGAEGSEQIAVSIVAEMLAVHAARPPRHLRERDGPMHETVA